MSWWICSGLPSCLFAGLLSKCHWRLLRRCVFTCCQWFPNTLSAAFMVWPQCVWVRAESDHEGCCKWQSMCEDKWSGTQWNNSFFLNKTEVWRNFFFSDESADYLLNLCDDLVIAMSTHPVFSELQFLFLPSVKSGCVPHCWVRDLTFLFRLVNKELPRLERSWSTTNWTCGKALRDDLSRC